MHPLSICMIFRDEAPYLKEWIEFHRLAGVDHFDLCNHRNQDNYLDVLTPYMKKGVVELTEMGGVMLMRMLSILIVCRSIFTIRFYNKKKKVNGLLFWIRMNIWFPLPPTKSLMFLMNSHPLAVLL